MLRFYFDKNFKYTNRTIIDLSTAVMYEDSDYENIDTSDSVNGHIIYITKDHPEYAGDNVFHAMPTYIVETVNITTGPSYERRWFVSGITQLRTGKYQLSLLRDLISETPMYWKNEEAYINSGIALDWDLLKYKKWDLPFTNTKVKEERLNFSGRSSYFVFYTNTQHFSGTTQGTITEDNLDLKTISFPGVSTYDYTFNGINSMPSYNYINAGDVLEWTNIDERVTLKDFPVLYNNFAYYRTYQYDGATCEPIGTDTTHPEPWPQPPYSDEEYYQIPAFHDSVLDNTNNCLTSLATAINNYRNTFITTLGTSISTSAVSNLSPYVGKIIYDSASGKVYKLNETTNVNNYNIKGAPGTLSSAIRNINWPPLSQVGDNPLPTFDSNGNWYIFKDTAIIHNYVLEELGTARECDFNFKSSSVRKLPKSSVRCVNIVADDINISDVELSQILMQLQANVTNLNNDTGKIIDIQYLPFSIATTTNSDFKITSGGQTFNLIAQFLDIDDFTYRVDLPDLEDMNKETDTINIVSPSRASQYLFSPFNNDGNMLFSVKVTIKPFASVIYVRPSTEGLLMYDWNDKDCLVINEDFSLSLLSSAYSEYVSQNRNYENAFNREIQGREYQREWEKRVEQAQAKSDEWNARNISAQKAQTYTGNIPIISNIAGAIGTAWVDQGYMEAARIDREYNQAMHDESISLAKDQFQMQLDNLKTMPTIPSKVTTIDIKFLDGIYLEFYSTNDDEKNQIEMFYKYNGNRIDAYGYFSSFYGWFVRGKIIRSEHYTQPEINEINSRLNLGIFTESTFENFKLENGSIFEVKT